ncbi:hypothetical protein N431DRAFT_488330 [Stipitochalara longipes BDJ]|nr:hypothetical protein N431DRAFT_488330 [Stipitochalara longipes BDJ]
MANSESDTLSTVAGRLVARKRSNSVSPNLRSRINSQASASRDNTMSTPPATPKRSKKRVRFSDPGPETELESASSGLTPFIRRTTLSTTPPPAGHYSGSTIPRGRSDYDIPISGTIQIKSLRQTLHDRVKRRLKRNGLSEEQNNIEWENRREVKLLRAEVERLRDELAELQITRDAEGLSNRGELERSITVNMELSARVQELEQQIADLKAELQQKDAESNQFEDTDLVIASRDLLDYDEDDARIITNEDFRAIQVNGTINKLDSSFLSPPPTMPNTPCKHSTSRNASAPSPNSANEVLDTRLHSELELRGESGLNVHTEKTAQSSIVRPRKKRKNRKTHVLEAGGRRVANKWAWGLVPDE